MLRKKENKERLIICVTKLALEMSDAVIYLFCVDLLVLYDFIARNSFMFNIDTV